VRNEVKPVRKDRFGELEIRLLSYAQLRRQAVMRLGEFREALDLAATQEKVALSRLARAGTIVRLKKEFYLMPSNLPLSGVWNPGPYLILRELMRVCGEGRYQLCGWEAFRRYGFTGQVPTRLDLYNNRLSGDRVIGGQSFTFIKVSDERLGSLASVTTPDGIEICLPSLARSLMDAVYDWSRFNTLPRAYEWIRSSVEKQPALVGKLAEVTSCYGNQGTVRRIGFVLSRLGLRRKWKEQLAQTLRSKASLIPLVPGQPAKGPVDMDWGVIVNEKS
jgi:predicted transcriptional regulator of viral defense system